MLGLIVGLVRSHPTTVTRNLEVTLVVPAGVLLPVMDGQHVLGVQTLILVSRNPLLPPSTGQWQPFDIHRMESSYVAIANSINNLAAYQLIRRPNDVNSEIIQTIQEKNVAARNGDDAALLSAFDEKLKDSNDELDVARPSHKNIVSNLRNQSNEESEPTDN